MKVRCQLNYKAIKLWKILSSLIGKILQVEQGKDTKTHSTSTLYDGYKYLSVSIQWRGGDATN